MSNSYELINNKKIELINKKKINNEIKAVTYSNEIRSDILEIHKKYKITSHQKNEKFFKVLCSCNWRI